MGNKENLFGGDLLLETGTNEIQLVEFVLRGQSFGVNVDKIQQIIEKPFITQIPESTAAMIGVFDFRKKVVPMIDLRNCLLFKGGKNDYTGTMQKVIVMDFNGVLNGFLVDDVKRLHRLSWEQIEPPDMIIEDKSELYMVGLIKFADRICIMVDFEKIIGSMNPELSIMHQGSEIVYNQARKGKKILFADDSNFVRNDVKKLLETAGFEVVACQNGAEALRILEGYVRQVETDGVGIEQFVTLIITDIEMPQMDGRHLTRRIKEHPILKSIPIFLFTSMSGMWNQMKAKTIGAEGLISKPEIHRMISLIDSIALK